MSAPVNHVLTSGGFRKLPLVAENEQKEKVRLYRLEPVDEKVQAAKSAIESKIKEGWEYKNSLNDFAKNIKTTPYLLKEGKTLSLLSDREAIELQVRYGAIGEKAEQEAEDGLKLADSVNTAEKLVALYNALDSSKQKELLPLVNAMIYVFSKKLTVLTPEQVKSVTALGKFENDGIRNGVLNLFIDLFEGSGFRNSDYGFGLKHTIDNLPKEFLQKNQLLLLSIFDKLSDQLDKVLHSGKSVNHELDPIMASLISVARATLNSELGKLAKGTKDKFYERLKVFYSNERYYKRVSALCTKTNYLLVHQSLWATQHLVRIASSEHKAINLIKRLGYGALAARNLASPVLAAAEAYQGGKIPDESLLTELQNAYNRGEKALGIKDIQRPWYEMLESTEQALFDPSLTEEGLANVYQNIQEYDKVTKSFNKHVVNKLKQLIGQDQVTQETKEFVFGFVGQLWDIAADHQKPEIRLKALDILGEIFNKKNQSSDVRVLILTALKCIVSASEKDGAVIERAKALQGTLHARKPKLEDAELFRQSKYQSLALIADDGSLLNAAKKKLEGVKQSQPLPSSKFIYGSKEIKVFEKKVTIGGNFAPKGPAAITADELERAVSAALKLHKLVVNPQTGGVSLHTEIGNKKETTFKEEVNIAGDFEG